MLLICSVDSLDWSASALICSATTANPRPFSPALAASMLALSARRFVWFDIPAIISVTFLISCADSFVRCVSLLTSSMACPLFSLIHISSFMMSAALSLHSVTVSTLSLSPSIFLCILSTALLIESVFTFISSTLSTWTVVLPVIVSTAELVLFTTSCIWLNILTNSSDTCSSSVVAILIADIVFVIPPNVFWILRTSSPVSSFLEDNF